jgi:hypothetical protein
VANTRPPGALPNTASYFDRELECATTNPLPAPIRRIQRKGFGNFADDKEYCGAMQNISC